MDEDRIIKNCMEQMVREHVTEILKSEKLPYQGICTCPRCVLDIEMEALNRLPSFYIACNRGAAKGDCGARKEQYREEIKTAVSRAMEIVAKRGHIGV